ncbi:MAG: carboxypeptidase regulatory-like domain-containing protein [Nocardioides sp.]
MYRVQYRNFGDHQTLVLNHTVDANGADQAGVRWYELDSTDGGGTWGIGQQGTYAPDSDSRWMASAAMDVSGNIAVGYSVSSDTTFPSIRVAGRLATDPLGELPQAENEMIAGSGSQTSGFSRWGDYSSMQVDSADECTFYYTQEYIATTGAANWQTRVGSFKFPNCSAGPSGVVTGTVTDSATSQPIAKARVSVGASSTTTNAAGHYSIRMPVGTYDVTASAFGYYPETVASVVVDDGVTVTQDFALDPQPTVTLSGTVTDGSGHGWPLYAKVSVQGVPVDPVFTSPLDGQYEFTLPADSTYTVAVQAQYTGYQTASDDVAVGSTDTTHDVSLPIDVYACTAPGYQLSASSGAVEGFDGGVLPAGWSIEDNAANGEVWTFDDPGGRGNLTGGDGGFAIIDSDSYGPDGNQDSSLVSPSYDLSAVDSPVLNFNQDYFNLGDTADVDVSIDGGATWDTVLHQTADARGPRTESIPLSQAANQSDVKVRFHYYDAFWAWWWQVDNVAVGDLSCDPVDGGLVVGLTSSTAGTPLNGTKVTSDDQPADFGISKPTPADTNLDDGFYYLFSSLTGAHGFTATNGKYAPQTESTTVVADGVVQLDFALAAGRVTVSPTSVVGKVTLGKKTSKSVVYRNRGDAPAHVILTEQNGSFKILDPDGQRTTTEQLLSERGAPVRHIRGTYRPTFSRKGTSPPGENESKELEADPWEDIADYPTDIMDNAMAYDSGKAYSIGGFDGNDVTAAGYVYDSTSLTWSPIADAPEALEKPSAAFVDGKLYLFGGWLGSGDPSSATYVYDPGSDSWSQASDMVIGVAAPGVTVHDGLIYAWGGCQDDCGLSDGQVYDPASDSWSSLADYPEVTSWQACGDVSGDIYCAGGTDGNGTSTATYQYDAGSDSWTQVADLPIDLWAMGYTGANGYLLVSGGVTDGFDTLTNEGFAYDPGSDSWSAIPNANEALYRGGSSCGFFRVGGSTGGFSPDAKAMLLAGFDQCGEGADVTWLKEAPVEFDLAPGATRKVVITMNSKKVTQPGTYLARVKAQTDTPSAVTPVTVKMKVKPPKTWGKLMGTVRGVACTGKASRLPGATVQINGKRYAQTLITGSDGGYAIWMSAAIKNLRMIVAKDGYIPQTRTTDVKPRKTTTENYRLQHVGCSG